MRCPRVVLGHPGSHHMQLLRSPRGMPSFHPRRQGIPWRHAPGDLPRYPPGITQGIPQGLGFRRVWGSPGISARGVIHKSSTDETKILNMCYLIPSSLVFLVWSLATPGAMGGLVFQGAPQGIPWGL
jgi:hypothetical protein